jgi:hypothetical protein
METMGVNNGKGQKKDLAGADLVPLLPVQDAMGTLLVHEPRKLYHMHCPHVCQHPHQNVFLKMLDNERSLQSLLC